MTTYFEFPRPYFLDNFYGATMTIKGSLQMKILYRGVFVVTFAVIHFCRQLSITKQYASGKNILRVSKLLHLIMRPNRVNYKVGQLQYLVRDFFSLQDMDNHFVFRGPFFNIIKLIREVRVRIRGYKEVTVVSSAYFTS